MKRIGITGGIGSGKSTVTAYIRSKGFFVVDADQVARDVVRPGKPVLARLVSEFGTGILREDGSLDRTGLAAMVFGDNEKKKKLDEITHTAILDCIRLALKEQEDKGKAAAFVDAALLMETGLHREMDEVWLVVAPEALRVKRVSLRDRVPPEKVQDRIRHQMGDEEKALAADRIIHNDKDLETLTMELDGLLEGLETFQ